MKISSFNRFFLLGLAALSASANATVRTWDASNGSDWNTTNTSWTGTTWNNATSDQAIFGTTGTGPVNLTEAITANKLTFNAGGHTIAGNTLTLSGTTPAIINTAGANAVNSNITFGAAITITNSDAANGLSLGGNLTGATTALTFTGAGTTTLSGTNTGLGDIRIANSTPSVGKLAITDGSTTFRNLNIGWSNGGAAGNSFAGVYTQSGGTVTCNGTANVILGDGNTTNQTLTGSFIQTGGTFNDNSQGIYMGNFSAALMDISGTSTFTALNRINIGLRGNSTLNISGNAVVTMPHVAFGGWGTWAVGTGVLNLDGGVLALAGGVGRNGNGAASNTSTFNFNGGILRATGSTPGSGQSGAYTDFMGGGTWGSLTNAYVKEGGAIIDSQANTITISQALKHGGVAPTDGGLTKQGSGTLTLAGINSYTGATTVTAGTLAISTAGSVALSDITVQGGGTLRVDTTGKTLQALAVENGGILGLAASTSATTTVTNALSFTSTPSFTVKPIFATAPVTGSYTLLTPGSIAGTAGTITTDLGIYGGTRVYTGSTTVTGGNLVLNMNAGGVAANLTWNNGGGTGNWSLTTPADNNFEHAGSDDMFYNLDTVTFNGTAPGTVTLVGALAPAAVTVDSATGADYTFAGGGSLTGPAALTKSGSSTLTINTANSHTGGTNLNGGTLALGNSGALGTTGTLSFGGGTLQYSAANTTDYSARLGTAGQQFKVDTNGQIVTWATALATGSGTLTKTGGGALRLTAAPKHGGLTVVNGGTLELTGSTVTYGGGNIEINNGATFKTSGNRYDFNGVTFTFGSTGGSSVEITNGSTGGGFVQLTAGNTFVTTGGAQNQVTGTGSANYNLNNQILTYDVASGTDAVSDLKVTAGHFNIGGITKTGAGRLELAGATNSYTGATTVSAGTLLVTGALGNTAVTVKDGAAFGGSGTVGGNLHLESGADFVLNLADADGLTVALGKTVSFGGFDLSNLIGLNSGIAEDTYTLISGTVDFTNVGDVGLANAKSIGDGKYAYFESGSLNLVVIPEPAASLLLGLGSLGLALRRRRG